MSVLECLQASSAMSNPYFKADTLSQVCITAGALCAWTKALLGYGKEAMKVALMREGGESLTGNATGGEPFDNGGTKGSRRSSTSVNIECIRYGSAR